MMLKKKKNCIYGKLRSARERIRHSHAVETARRLAAPFRVNPFPPQVFLVLLYRLILDVLYLKIVFPFFAYMGFTAYLQLDFYAFTLLVLLIFAPFIARLQEEKSASAAILTFLHYIYFIPLTSYCACSGAPLTFFLIGSVYWAIMLLIQFRLPVIYLQPMQTRRTQRIYCLLTLLGVAFVMFISWRYTGLRFTLDFINVYDIRAEAASYQMPKIFSYALSMMSVLLAILLMYWMIRRKRVVVGTLIVVFLFLFSIAAHKSQFFFLLLVLSAYFFYRPWMLRWAGGLMIIFASGALAEWLILDSYYLAAYFFRRMMYTPMLLSEACMRLFQDNPLNLFRVGIMGKLSFDEIYSINIPYLVAESFGEKSSANTGLLGDMFANLPTPLGIILMPIILVVCFRIMDATAHHLPQKLTISACLFFAMSFSNSSWSTVLLSHGFLLACLLFYFFPKEETLT